MAITAFKIYVAGEILTASDLNSSLLYITQNALAMISPLTGSLDVDGQDLILDSDGDSILGITSDDVLTLALNGVDLFAWNGATASVVNGLVFTAAATGNPPSITAAGSDTNIDLELRSKGTGDVVLADSAGEEILVCSDVASAVNELQITNAATGNPVLIDVTGGDANISLSVTPKGTGSINLLGSTVLLQGVDVASASALPVNIAGNLFDVTGTTTVTSIASKGVGSIVTLQFDGILTLTHHATDLVLPGGANILTYAGYVAAFYEYASGDYRFMGDNRAAYTTARITTTGGMSVEFTGIPSWATKFTLLVQQMSGSGSFSVEIVLGTASGYETTGYTSSVWSFAGAAVAIETTNIPICVLGLAGYNYKGSMEFALLDRANNTWVWDGGFAAGAAELESHNGGKILADTLTKMKLTITSGTFDAMNIALRIEP